MFALESQGRAAPLMKNSLYARFVLHPLSLSGTSWTNEPFARAAAVESFELLRFFIW